MLSDWYPLAMRGLLLSVPDDDAPTRRLLAQINDYAITCMEVKTCSLRSTTTPSPAWR
jgi:hypothetical protein